MNKLSLIIWSRVNGGHEIQAIKLANSLANYFELDLFSNYFISNNKTINNKLKLNIINYETCAKGNFFNQIIYSYKLSKLDLQLRKIADNEIIIISAGAVEASISMLFSLLRLKKRKTKIILYLPFFFDRRLIWPFPLGNIYNRLLGFILNKFDLIITINELNKRIVEKMTSKR